MKANPLYLALPGLIVLTTGPALAAGELAETCAAAEPEARSEVAGLSHVELHRDATDLTGTRIIGCLHNLSDEPIPNMMLGIRHIQERGGGGGSTNLEFNPVEPGQAVAFRSGLFTRDRAHFEEWEATGMRITKLERFGQDPWVLDEPIELPLPLLDRPEHPVESECAGVDPDAGEGDVWISHARFQEAGPTGVTYVVGCVTNRSEETLAEGRRQEIGVRHSGRTGSEPERMGSRGGTGNLQLAAPLEPGQTAFFITSFEYDAPLLDVEIEPGGMQQVDNAFEFVASGPAVGLQRGLED